MLMRKETKKKKNRRKQWNSSSESISIHLNPIALRKAKIVYNFGLSESNRVNPIVKIYFGSG